MRCIDSRNKRETDAALRRKILHGSAYVPYSSAYLVSIPPGTEMFYFPGFALAKKQVIELYSIGFPHSDIFGSKIARHLPEAYRRQAASFIATLCLGIRHMLLI